MKVRLLVEVELSKAKLFKKARTSDEVCRQVQRQVEDIGLYSAYSGNGVKVTIVK